MFRFDRETRREFSDNWLLLAIAFCCLLFSLSIPSYIMPFIFPEVIREFGWTREQAAALASAKFGVGAIAALLVGRLIDTFGAWVLLLVSTIISGGALLAFIWLNSFPTYFIIGMALGFAGPGGIVGVKVIVSRSFHAAQGTAMGVVLLGTTLCSILAPLVITHLMGTLGWRYGIAAMSAGVWFIVIPLLVFGLFSKSSKLQVGQNRRGKAGGSEKSAENRVSGLLRQRDFWLMVTAIFLTAVADQGFKQHQVLIFLDAGLSPGRAALAVSSIGVSLIVARILVGNILDSKSNRGLSLLLLSLSAAALLAFYIANPVVLLFYVLFRSVGNACVTLDAAVMGKHMFGMENIGMILGIFTAVNSVGSSVGPWIMGRLFDAEGSYSSSFILFAVLPALSAALVWVVKPTFWLSQQSGELRAAP